MAELKTNKNTINTVKILWLYLGNIQEIWEERRSKGCKKKGLAKGSRKSCKFNVKKKNSSQLPTGIKAGRDGFLSGD